MIFGGLFGGQQKARSPEQLGYERDGGTDFLIDYLQNNRLSEGQTGSYGRTILNAVQQGNLDQRSALSSLEARTDPNSAYFGSEDYENLLNYQMPEDKSRNIIGDAYSTNYFRAPSSSELDEMYAQAFNAGVINDPNELRNFTTSTLARMPEGEDKRPFDDYQYRMASYYGAPVRDSQGRNTGQYRQFGYDSDKYAAADKSMADTKKFTDNYLNRMGAKS